MLLAYTFGKDPIDIAAVTVGSISSVRLNGFVGVSFVFFHFEAGLAKNISLIPLLLAALLAIIH